MPNINIITYCLDDDREELEIIESYLTEVCGANIELHTDAQAFVSAIEDGNHIGIVDHQMGKVNGIDIGRLVISKKPFCFLILFTGNESFAVAKEALNNGFGAIVGKNEINAYQQLAEIVKKRQSYIQMMAEFRNKYENRLQTPEI